MFDLLNSDNELVARKALDVMVELYRRQVWIDARSVNVISAACLSKVFLSVMQILIICSIVA